MRPLSKKCDLRTQLGFVASFVSILLLLSLCGLAESKNQANDDLNDSSIVADLGFRPDVDGFSFSNYAGEKGYEGLTPEDLRRMVGKDVCASQPKGNCILTPTWTYWLEMANSMSDGGHCQGMAVLSLLLYEKLIDVNDFGADRTIDLGVAGNGVLQKEIAYWFSHQLLEPTISSGITAKPSFILDELKKSLQDENKTRKYTIAFYKRDGSDGHAVTPFAVRDAGDGIYEILVYDNNYPREARAIVVDRSNESWTYESASNPNDPSSLYEGDADSLTLELLPLYSQLVLQNCSSLSEDVCQIWAEGDADLLIVDGKSRMLGFENGELMNEIPGSQVVTPVADDKDNATTFFIMPALEDFKVLLQNTNPETDSVVNLTILSPENIIYAENITLGPGQADIIAISPPQSLMGNPTTNSVVYYPGGDESPTLTIGALGNNTSYVFAVATNDLQEGMALTMLDISNYASFGFTYTNTTKDYTFDMGIGRIDESGEQLFGHEGVEIAPDCVAVLQYGNWTGNSQPMPMNLVCGDDSETVELKDVNDELPK
ncbi:MAG: hypothetical protein EHM14_00530 [Methanothrix sp.]|nr:MAG: hypothetical protein EHM14_00530 [Methanothrix sp.]